MSTTAILSPVELDRQVCDLLPRRETLELIGAISINVSPVIAFNTAIAVNAASISGAANAYAGQWLSLSVHG